jgi:hypothetical protein
MNDQEMFSNPSHVTSVVRVEEDLQQDELNDTNMREVVLRLEVQLSDFG